MKIIDVAIVGAGFGGLCAAIRLRESGVDNVAILERSGEVGGTWRDNVYPGCACDVPSHMYSFSFEPNTRWTRPYPQQPEIQDYILRLTDTYRLRPLIRFHSDVRSMRWLADRSCWELAVEGHPPLLARHVAAAGSRLPQALVPLPLHAARYRERGFNQAEVIARHVASRTGVPLDALLLQRLRATAPQTTLSASERRHNCTGAFAARPGRRSPARVALLDDVMTTGSTAAAAAEALRAAGARHVELWVCALALA